MGVTSYLSILRFAQLKALNTTADGQAHLKPSQSSWIALYHLALGQEIRFVVSEV